MEDNYTLPTRRTSQAAYGYSFKGRHSVVIDDESSDFGEDDEHEEDEEEDGPILRGLASEDVQDQESSLVDTEYQTAESESEEERGAEPRTPEVRPTALPAEISREEAGPVTRPTQPTEAAEPSGPANRPSVEMPRPNVDSQGSETSSKFGKPPIPSKSSAIPWSSKQAGKRRKGSGIATLDKHLGDGIDELTEHEEEEYSVIIEADGDEEQNGSRGTSLFARGVVDRYKLAVFRKSTPSRHGNRKISGVSNASVIEDRSPSPSEKRSRGRPTLSFQDRKNVLKTPPTLISSSTSGTSKQHAVDPSSSKGFSSTAASSAALNQSSSTNIASPSLRSKQSAMRITSPSESDFSPNDDTTRAGVLGREAPIRKSVITSPSESDFSPNDDTTRAGILGREAPIRKSVPRSPTDERKKKKKLKGAEKVLAMFS